MLRKGVIEPCRRARFTARLFPVGKPDGSIRMIIDLSLLNRSIVTRSFRFPSIWTLRAQLVKGVFLAKIDLKEAYWHVPIASKFRPFLAFRWKNRLWRFRAMPFGLSVAPVAFQALMNVPRKILLAKGIQLLNYLDDWIIWAPSLEECSWAVAECVRTLETMGFLLNWEKSEVSPVQRITWLGPHWDSVSEVLSLPPDSALKIAQKVKIFLERDVATRRDLESLLGSMVFVGQWLPEAKLHKNFCLPFLSLFPLNRKTSVPIPEGLRSALLWWTSPLNISRPVPLHTPPIKEWIWTDASDLGWGAHLANGEVASGRWNLEETSLHINVKELRAVVLGLKHLVPAKNCSIRVFCDNVTATFAMRNWGSRKSPRVTREAGHLLNLCLLQKWFLSPRRIESAANVLADQLSREVPLPGEWSLSPELRASIFAWAGRPEIDLMATPFNRQTEAFISVFEHPATPWVDARQVDWTRWQFAYLFPPPDMIQWALEKIAEVHLKILLISHLPQDSPLWNLPKSPRIRLPLEQPPRQLVQNKWVYHSGSSWTATLFLPKS